jgi:hypothetical protein
MKQKILLCCLTLLGYSSFAQDSSFSLKNYKYRTTGFRGLSIGFNLGGSAYALEVENTSKVNMREFDVSLSQLQYYRTVSTDKRLHASSISLSPSYHVSSRKETNTENSKMRHLSSSASWARNDKFYKNNQWFFEAGNEFSFYAADNRRNEVTTNQKHNRSNLQNTVTLGFGKGRVENVQDAQMALYILNDLQQQGLLDAPAQPAAVNELAQLITAINNRRVFDDRRRKIFELTQIDSFLRSSSLIKDTDIRHFTTINDNWALAFNPGRSSGSHWFVRLQPGAGFEKANQS